ncbi:MAG: isoprenylcysteine carboxylmethyltransferase family protein [Anaerolineales bacterium]
MISGISLSVLLGVVVIAFFFMDFFFMIRYDRERELGKGWAWDYTLLVGGLGLVVVLQPAFFPIIGFFTQKSWGLMVQVFGFVLVILSFVIHIWARLHLQKFYAERVEIQSDHKLINTGPYKWMRHPLVTSFFLLGTGVFFLSPALTTLVAMLYVYWDFSRAAKAEDELLGKNLPGYLDYMERVPRFLPRWKK